MNTFLRIEHKDTGRGMYVNGGGMSYLPYTIYDIQAHARADNGRPPKHPNPRDDSLLVQNFKSKGLDLNAHLYDFIFGFSSMEQLRTWMYDDRWLATLHKNGFVLCEYEGEIIHGNAQAIIRNSTKKQIWKLNLEILLNKEDEEAELV